jgi:hypothetical protein
VGTPAVSQPSTHRGDSAEDKTIENKCVCVTRREDSCESGRWDSNPQQPAWKAKLISGRNAQKPFINDDFTAMQPLCKASSFFPCFSQVFAVSKSQNGTKQ